MLSIARPPLSGSAHQKEARALSLLGTPSGVVATKRPTEGGICRLAAIAAAILSHWNRRAICQLGQA